MASVVNAAGNLEGGISPANLFPLDGPEPVVCFHRDDGHVFRHIFRRLTAADFELYFDSSTVDSEAEGRSSAECINDDEARLVLYRRAIFRVEGYQTRDGCEPQELPTWPECIPLEHRLFAVGLLLEHRGAIAKDTFQIGPGNRVGFVIVRDESESLTAKKFFGVTHHFRMPTAAHQKRFLSALSKFPAASKELISLHDELVVSAEGYAFGGAPIAPEQLQGEMWMGFKLYAVSAFFFSFDNGGPEPRRIRTVTLPGDLLGTRTPAPAPRVEVH